MWFCKQHHPHLLRGQEVVMLLDEDIPAMEWPTSLACAVVSNIVRYGPAQAIHDPKDDQFPADLEGSSMKDGADNALDVDETIAGSSDMEDNVTPSNDLRVDTHMHGTLVPSDQGNMEEDAIPSPSGLADTHVHGGPVDFIAPPVDSSAFSQCPDPPLVTGNSTGHEECQASDGLGVHHESLIRHAQGCQCRLAMDEYPYEQLCSMWQIEVNSHCQASILDLTDG